jgi:NitT/TauT family transport system permease protein
MSLKELTTPNASLPERMYLTIGAGWIVTMLLLWLVAPSIIPSPREVVSAFPVLWDRDGLGVQLWVSFTTNLEAATLMTLFSLVIAYLTVLPIFRPFAVLVSSGRFNGFVGLPLVFLALLNDPVWVKIALLVYGVGVFVILSVVKLIDNIPKEQFDHSRTLRMNEWRVAWEDVVLGQFDQVIDILRVNLAMLWMLLPMVEGLFRFQGGVGALMLDQEKHFDMAAVFCSLFLILGIGLLQDFLIGKVKDIICPYASLGLQR